MLCRGEFVMFRYQLYHFVNFLTEKIFLFFTNAPKLFTFIKKGSKLLHMFIQGW